jgi:hypothetical protein
MVNLQFAEKIDALKGHDFSRAVSAAETEWALAPEGRFSGIQQENERFSAACLAAYGMRVAENAFPQSLLLTLFLWNEENLQVFGLGRR